MKKIITSSCFFFISLICNAQSSVLLFEDFESSSFSNKLLSNNNLTTYLSSSGQKTGSLDYNSSNYQEVQLSYMLSANTGVDVADSVTVQCINDFNSSRSNRERGTISIVNDTIIYQDSTVTTVGIGNTKIPFVLHFTANEKVNKAEYTNTGSVLVSKTFKRPFKEEIDILNVRFSKKYTLDGKSDDNPQNLIETICFDRFKNSNPSATACILSLSNNIPEISDRQILIDDITIKLFSSTVTSIGNTEFRIKSLTVSKAFNIWGQEAPIDTKNEIVILKYDDGTTDKVFRATF